MLRVISVTVVIYLKRLLPFCKIVIIWAYDDNRREVSISAITSSCKYLCFDSNGGIMDDSSAWQNMVVARCYQFDKVYRVDYENY